MKTPDEIKKGMACCLTRWEGDYLASCHTDCPYRNEGIWCRNALMHDIAESYKQVKSRLDQAERERAALKHDMRQCQSAVCNACKHHYRPNPDVRFYECALLGRFSDFLNSDDDRPFICGKFEWRGVCPENTKE